MSDDDSRSRPQLRHERPPGREVLRLRDLAQFFRPYPLMVTAAIVLMAVSSGAELALGWAMQQIVDQGLTQDKLAQLDRHFGVMLGIVAVFATTLTGRLYVISWLGERVVADLRRRVYDHVLTLSPTFYEVTKTGEILSRLTTDTTMVQAIASQGAPIALRSIFVLLGGVGLMLWTSPKLSNLVLVALPVLMVPIVIFAKVVRRLSRESQDRVADISSTADESLSAIETVQAFTHEAHCRQAFGDAAESAVNTAMRRVRAWSILNGVAVLMMFSLVIGVLWFGARAVVNGTMTGGELTAFLIYSVMVANAFGALSEIWGQFQRAAGATERLMEIMAAEPTIAAPARPRALPSPVTGRIAFENVTFHYPTRPLAPALNDFSLEIAPGETVALVGPSGSGKSTVFKLLLRFYDPDAGRVLLDDVPLPDADPAAIREQVSLVPQSPVVFATSALENIRYGRPSASDEEVRAAADSAAATDFIAALPDGFETYLGDRGARLSGGQKQRIAIARAVLRHSGVLLFDEATSALDSESESLVHAALERLSHQRTTLIIAHRLATVLGADRIVVMDQGRIVATGTHYELMAQDGLYARLARLQFETAEEALQVPEPE